MVDWEELEDRGEKIEGTDGSIVMDWAQFDRYLGGTKQPGDITRQSLIAHYGKEATDKIIERSIKAGDYTKHYVVDPGSGRRIVVLRPTKKG